jgi:hypothetical protein
MDWLYNINYILFNWLPWLNFFNDIFLLQFLMLYTVYLIYFTNNLYFVLFYLFLEFIYFGLFLSMYNLELFTAFLWLTECVIVFVSIIFLFYFNIYSNYNVLNIYIYSFKYFGFFIGLIILSIFFISIGELEFYLPHELNFFFIWDDFYEAFNNNKFNDLYSLFLSYYYINSLEFIIVGLLLLFASMVCVNLNKFTKNLRFNNYYEFLVLFDFFNDFVNYTFLRKQNLNDQTLSNSSTRFFKKKTIK